MDYKLSIILWVAILIALTVLKFSATNIVGAAIICIIYIVGSDLAERIEALRKELKDDILNK